MARPILGGLAVGLPIAVALTAAVMLAMTSNGNARMGILVLGIAGMGVAAVLGLLSALGSLARGESLPWLAALAVAVNLAVLVPVAQFLFKK